MADQSFNHIPLTLIKDAPPKRRPPGGRKKHETTLSNYENRQGHSNALSKSATNVQKEWEVATAKRKAENLPPVPAAVPIFLKVDPAVMSPEDLRVFGIEVISELEEGYIIGASQDVTLSKLYEKIKKLADGEKKTAGLWQIAEGTLWRTENILSPRLLEDWHRIQDEQLLVVDVGVAVLGLIKVPEHPEKRKAKLKDYEGSVRKWKPKVLKAYQEWRELSLERARKLRLFVEGYNGDIIGLDGSVRGIDESQIHQGFVLPDSFTCRVQISGKGLKDLVLNFPFIFDVAEVQRVGIPDHEGEITAQLGDEEGIILNPPDKDAPFVCVIDSGIQENHVLLDSAIPGTDSKSWVGASDTDVADYVPKGGHGTRVAGAVLYPHGVPKYGSVKQVCWIQNARVLDNKNSMPINLFPSTLLGEVVNHFYNSPTRTRIFNHSINSLYPCRLIHMSAWAASIDALTWEHDVLFTVSAGNLRPDRPSSSNLRLGIRDHIGSGRDYPNYLLEPSSRIADPAQSLQAITVGSVGVDSLNGLWKSLSNYSEPSSFSCTGLGVWGVIKPEIVEFGGDYAYDGGFPPGVSFNSVLAPELVRSTMHGGNAISKDVVGTSFTAPKATHIVAALAKLMPDETTLMYRALLIQSARWPQWTVRIQNKLNVLRHIGYGIPDVSRATTNSPYRITLITNGENRIRARQVHIFEVKIPEELRNPAEDFDIRVEVTLSYKAAPRRTRRDKRRYLSTWLHWQTSKKNETTESFVNRMIEQVDVEDEDEGEETENIRWTIGERNNHGLIKDVNRSAGTVQKDWATIKSHDWSNGFCIAVVGHTGWDPDPESTVPYSLVVSFEAVNQDVEIYSRVSVANRVEVEEEVEVRQ